MSLVSALLLATTVVAPQAVEVPFHLGEDAIIVDATLNNRPLRFMFDTGFSGSFVVSDSINLGKPTGSMLLRDFVGQFEAKTVKLTSVKVGSKSIPGDHFEAVMQPGDYSFSYNTHTDGIMGFEVVKDNVLEINFQEKKFVFHPKSYDITQKKPDNQKTFLAKLLPTGHDSLEMEVKAANGERMVLALDTGNAFYATTHRDVLERCGLWDKSKKPKFQKSSFVASGEVESWYKQMNDVTIFGVPVKQSVWSIIELPSSSAEGDGTIGFGFLKNFNITIDFDRRRVWLENFTGKTGSDEVAQPGISAAFNERAGRVMIYRVTPGSPAEAAGIKPGDTVLSIDGKELLGNVDFREIEKMLTGEAGSKVTLNISHAGNLKRMQLDRVMLVNE